MEQHQSTNMKKNYFFIASILLLLLSLLGFADNLFYDVNQESNSDPKFIIHGLFFLAWFIILVIQSGYISKGNYKAHMSLGIAGMLIGLGVVVSTFYVFVAVYEGWDVMPFYVKANRFFTTTFAVFVLLAYVNRKSVAKHKRYLYMGTLFILGPIIDRIPGNLGFEIESFISFTLYESVIWNSFFISLFVYDWITLKRIHPISWAGVIWFYIVWVVCFFLV
jgi:hypothetical protein